ncbi:MAG: hypothetical protein E7319_09240 [Clostridiales bacterium]|nr:hypothetical protein [Clostridiales bacterium]
MMKKFLALALALMMMLSLAPHALAAQPTLPTFGAFAGEEAEYITSDDENNLHLYSMADQATAKMFADNYIMELVYAFDFETIKSESTDTNYYVWVEGYTGEGNVKSRTLDKRIEFYVLMAVSLDPETDGAVVFTCSNEFELVDTFEYPDDNTTSTTSTTTSTTSTTSSNDGILSAISGAAATLPSQAQSQSQTQTTAGPVMPDLTAWLSGYAELVDEGSAYEFVVYDYVGEDSIENFYAFEEYIDLLERNYPFDMTGSYYRMYSHSGSIFFSYVFDYTGKPAISEKTEMTYDHSASGNVKFYGSINEGELSICIWFHEDITMQDFGDRYTPSI